MKTTVYFKQFLPALATLVTVGFASSCQDQNFDWDDAHAITYQEKFSNTFFKEFGKPAEGHQWGFDKPWVDTYITRSTRAEVYKADGQDQSLPGISTYGIVPNITPTEHQEVYEWFSTHRVDWTTKTVNYDPEDGWCMLDNNGNIVYQDKSNNRYGKYVAKFDGSGNEISNTRIEGDFVIIMGDNNPTKQITQRAGNNTRKDGVSIAHAYNGGTPSTSSLYTYSSDKNGDTNVGITIDFTGAWIQHVAGDKDSNIPEWCKEKTSFGDPVFAANEYNSNGSLNNVGMDQMNFYDKNGVDLHVYDFNGIKGWGWNRQSILDEDGHWLTNDEFQKIIKKAYDDALESSKDFNTANNAAQAKYNELVTKYGLTGESGGNPAPSWYNNVHTGFLRNGTLILGADFNQTTYNSTRAETNYYVQDKWIIVYLKGKNPDGTFYEGWYLGFDLEAAGDSKDKMVEANGFCNNWIIKLTAVNEAKSTEPIRIMCEDLGGEANEVHIGNKVHISDIDYNDIVLDVTPDNTNKNITLTLRAAGGTIPLTVWYNGNPLFETHEMFQAGKSFQNTDHKNGIDYSIMYNTQGTNTKDGVTPKEYKLNLSQVFDINKLEIKVWRLNADQYTETSPNDFSDALWVNISNVDGQAPLKLCVPQTVKWLKERSSIKAGYPDFIDWVKDPSGFFWNKTVVSSYLCN